MKMKHVTVEEIKQWLSQFNDNEIIIGRGDSFGEDVTLTPEHPTNNARHYLNLEEWVNE